MKVIVIDDETLARTHIKKLLNVQGAEVVGEGKTGVDALRLSEELTPDVVFLDIQMPDLTGMQVAAALNQLETPPLIVFVTGFSEHAPKAFEHGAIDYLLKPVPPERLSLTLTRIRKQLQQHQKETPTEIVPEQLTPLKRLPVRTDYAIKLVRIEEIMCATSRDKKVYVHTPTAEHKTYYTLGQLEKLLPEDEFMRIHASVIVRLDNIEELNFLGNHTYSVELTSGLVLPVGRTHFPELQKKLGVHAVANR